MATFGIGPPRFASGYGRSLRDPMQPNVARRVCAGFRELARPFGRFRAAMAKPALED
jgi:hypothetical protein